MHTTEISAAIRPYSMAVTPDSFSKKRVTMFFMLTSSVNRSLPSSATRCRDRRDRLPRPRIIAGASCIRSNELVQILCIRSKFSLLLHERLSRLCIVNNLTKPIVRAGAIELFGKFSQRQFGAIGLKQNNQMPKDVSCENGCFALRRDHRTADATKKRHHHDADIFFMPVITCRDRGLDVLE